MRRSITISLLPLHAVRLAVLDVLAKLRGLGWSVHDQFVKVPSTEQELEAWFSKAFDCEEGEAAAFYHRMSLDRLTITQHRYTTHRVICQESAGAEARLCQFVYDDFKQYAYRGLKLVWRRLPRIEHDYIITWGKIVADNAMVEDGLWKPFATDVFNEGMGTWHDSKIVEPVACLRLRLNIEMPVAEHNHTNMLRSYCLEGYPALHI